MRQDFIHELLNGHPQSLRLWCAIYVRCSRKPGTPIDIRELKRYSKLSGGTFYRALDLRKYERFVRFIPTGKSLFIVEFTGGLKADANNADNQSIIKDKRTESGRKIASRGRKADANNAENQISKQQARTENGPVMPPGVVSADGNNIDNQDVKPVKRTETAIIKQKADANNAGNQSNIPVVRIEIHPPVSSVNDGVKNSNDLREDHIKMSSYERAKARFTLDLRNKMMAVWNRFYQSLIIEQRLVANVPVNSDNLPKASYTPSDIKGLILMVDQLTRILGFTTDDEIANTFDWILSNIKDLPPNISNYTTILQIQRNTPQIFRLLSKGGSSQLTNKQQQRDGAYKQALINTQQRDYSKFVSKDHSKDH